MSDFSAPHASGFKTEGTYNPDHLYDRFDVRPKVTIAEGQGTLLRGSALGKVTDDEDPDFGKWKLSLAAAEDGSEVIRGILLYDVNASGGDAEGIVGQIGRCNGGSVIFGTGHSLASAFDDCQSRGIIFETVIGA